ncbi:extracellular catalytic domain type 1 short-chain-length polyhydroxyalkanoate depolymerase [Myceligenerans xiligouense]|uniref:Poly(Hydroxyalkanoate) depolymerase family esterase n=1 Tax=Myceligenerans xiligouense TaxID=253184 RepID=A0A3N4YR39_9MICO|nr:PHB depolymerase family esterase [Myceligenerans xiligouense]RPF22577.1 poly(hydroxyalkanoate) depolymerase family esterase [Myceligenerans xiligouense]
MKSLISATAALGLALTGGVAAIAAAPPATAGIVCPPPFDILPGCTSADDDGVPGDGGTPDGGSTAAGDWTSRSAGGMTTQLYVPTSAPAIPAGRALTITLHGCVQTSSDLRGGGNWEATADDYGMVVAVPAAPDGGVLLGCWDYYGSNHSRTSPARHDDNLLDLVDDLLADASLGIDPDQVYVTGLSSGGGETLVMGCLAPDVFAGIGSNAGPAVGTSSAQISYVATTQAQATSTCRNFAGTASGAFGTQLASVVYGSDDSTVAPGYNTLNAQVMAGIYGAADQSPFALDALEGNNTTGSGTLWSDADGPRVSLIQNSGLGHNWPAGGGPGGSYISTNSIDYPAYVTGFFFENNRRVNRSGEPSPSPDPTDPSPEPTDPSPEPTDPGPTDPGAYCGSATNTAHEAAGRATSYGVNPYNPYYANGSLDYMGQGDTTTTTLSETSPGHYDVVPSC